MNLIFYVCSKLDLVILSFAIQITIIKNKTTANIVGNLYCYIFGLFAAFKLKYWIVDIITILICQTLSINF